jgi:DHA1 family bicyclomycin/chloramphenicol resistance-like MFS transporter
VKDLAKSWWFLVVLVGATALGPLAIQIFLPSLPAIQADLQVSGSLAQLVFSLSAGAIAVSMLVYGPVSDRFGRRPTLGSSSI